MGIKKLFKRITGIAEFETIIEAKESIIKSLQKDKDDLLGFQKSINVLRKVNFATKINNEKLLKQLAEKNAEIRQVEKNLESTIDQQYDEIQKLKTQLEHVKNNRVGKFYVFNPQHGQPRKIYDTYEAAMRDAESVAKISKGQKVFVLKIVSGVQISEIFEDYSLIPEEEIPF